MSKPQEAARTCELLVAGHRLAEAVADASATNWDFERRIRLCEAAYDYRAAEDALVATRAKAGRRRKA